MAEGSLVGIWVASGEGGGQAEKRILSLANSHGTMVTRMNRVMEGEPRWATWVSTTCSYRVSGTKQSWHYDSP